MLANSSNTQCMLLLCCGAVGLVCVWAAGRPCVQQYVTSGFV